MKLPNDDILQEWILITDDKNYSLWLEAFLQGAVKFPPPPDTCIGEIYLVESIAFGFACVRNINSVLSSSIINLNKLIYQKLPPSFVEPLLSDIANKIKHQGNEKALSIFPSIIKEYYHAKVSNEAD